MLYLLKKTKEQVTYTLPYFYACSTPSVVNSKTGVTHKCMFQRSQQQYLEPLRIWFLLYTLQSFIPAWVLDCCH